MEKLTNNDRITDLLASLKRMLRELDEKELDIVEDYITNHCDTVGRDMQVSNLFRTFICDPWYDFEEIRSWNPED